MGGFNTVSPSEIVVLLVRAYLNLAIAGGLGVVDIMGDAGMMLVWRRSVGEEDAALTCKRRNCGLTVFRHQSKRVLSYRTVSIVAMSTVSLISSGRVLRNASSVEENEGSLMFAE